MKTAYSLRFPALATTCAIALLLGACSDAAFKRGAQGDDFRQASQHCRQKTADDSAYRQCLRAGGWAVLEALSLPVFHAKDSPATLPRGEHALGTPPDGQTVPRIEAKENALSASDLTKRIRVGSWWKFGAGSERLQEEMTECADTLGGDHAGSRPQEITLGMAACMRQKGWQAMP